MAIFTEDKERIWKKVMRKMKEVGFKNVVRGGLKKVKYRTLIEKYHFDTWHLNPYEWKEYAQACVRCINSRSCGTVVDIGCGLGEILQHIKADKRIGLDLQEEVVMAARELNRGEIRFETGSFGDLTERPVDYLITLNFMHGGTESDWAEIYHVAALRNDVKHFVVDTVPEKAFGPTTHFLDWRKILPENYKRVERLGPFLIGRYIEVWEKQ
ncbi:MAG: SAM-dependent methyltransferase [Lachnospiraceae bacterium]|nr:SAM-dependent methyltransferase [Lachnospiraceae bacterium]